MGILRLIFQFFTISQEIFNRFSESSSSALFDWIFELPTLAKHFFAGWSKYSFVLPLQIYNALYNVRKSINFFFSSCLDSSHKKPKLSTLSSREFGIKVFHFLRLLFHFSSVSNIDAMCANVPTHNETNGTDKVLIELYIPPWSVSFSDCIHESTEMNSNCLICPSI